MEFEETVDIMPMYTQKRLTANTLKIIAVAAMTVDHLTWLLLPGYRTDILTLSLHAIGRLTAPIMMFFIAEGFHCTKNIKKYILRLFLFAFIAHFAYAMLFAKSFIPFQHTVFDQTSVLWTFALGLVALAVTKSENAKLKPWHRQAIVWVCIIAAFCADWSSPAAVIILYIGINRGDFKKQMLWFMIWIAMYAIVYAIFLNPVYGALQMLTALAVPLLHGYNGQRGKLKWKGMKWFFYIYYPAHLFVLGAIRILILSR
ncbi:MAG: conjugal transfer protein TraX [Clostridiales Family XIII bacterium]|nr:conjugal transfer protein TraX [Clostridiales Family XIII bacterium]